MEAAFEKTLDPAAGKSVAGISNLFVDDLFGTGGNEMEQRVLTRLKTYFQVGSEDSNDAAFTGQRIRWTQESQNGPCIEVNQNKAIDELEEIPVKRNTKEDLHCSPSMHTMYRSLRGHINWLQSRTQFKCCYNFSIYASMAASPTVGKSQTSFNTGHSLDQWEYVDFLMPLTEITMMALHREAWQCSWQNRGSDLQGRECRMEV